MDLASRHSALNPTQRDRALESLADIRFDVIVVGGGVTGAGAALDAASRGLRVGLVEQRDYASGTSSRSSKLFHGGLRYLEHLEFGLVREALRERNLMLTKLSPHLAQPVSFVYPLTRRVWERAYVGAGVLLYEMLARRTPNPLPRHQHLSRAALRSLAPALDPAKTHGGVRYWDVLVDDARHTMTLARTAATHGAALASSARVTAISQGPGGDLSLEVTDLESGSTIDVTSRSVINATGVWSDDIQHLAGSKGLDVEASKGVHILVPRDRIESETGMILRTSVSVLFVIPFGENWILGTTDTPWKLQRAHPAASRRDIDYLIGWANTVLAKPLRTDDVVGVYAGLRPLLAGESDDTSSLSREHAVVDNGSGLISVAGGKYTTYRVMAADAVDAATAYLDRTVPSSVTASLPLVGARSETSNGDEGREAPISPEERLRLQGRYGSLVTDILDIIDDDPDMAARVVVDAPYTRAEILYAATHEGAMHLDDFLTRRTRISIETRHRGLRAAPEVAGLIAEVLGWDKADIEREIEHYRARVEAERDSQRQPDDHTADAARLGAPDVRTGSSE